MRSGRALEGLELLRNEKEMGRLEMRGWPAGAIIGLSAHNCDRSGFVGATIGPLAAFALNFTRNRHANPSASAAVGAGQEPQATPARHSKPILNSALIPFVRSGW